MKSPKHRIATVGMFDGVHCGHRFLVGQMQDEASKRGLATEVISFLAHPLATISPDKVPPMLSTADERAELIESLGVDYCRMLDFDDSMRRLTAREFMSKLKGEDGVEVMMLGFDNRFGSDRLSDISEYQRVGRDLGIEVLRAKEYPGVSSSVIRDRILNRDMEGAAVALGRRYSLSGTVVEGKKLGRTIGFPTANVEVGDRFKLIPPAGVYACVAETGGMRYGSMVNIGRCPTVGNRSEVNTIEAHLFGYDGDLYGKGISIEFVAYMRHERRFESLAMLESQLRDDSRLARSLTVSAL